VRHGTKEYGFPSPKTGEMRYKFTFADVVFITDSTCKQEITSWPAPGAGLDAHLVSTTSEMRTAHKAACDRNRLLLSVWTSHTVVVVDQSGSMRKTDVLGGTSGCRLPAWTD
jgi:hypothetical protein